MYERHHWCPCGATGVVFRLGGPVARSYCQACQRPTQPVPPSDEVRNFRGPGLWP